MRSPSETPRSAMQNNSNCIETTSELAANAYRHDAAQANKPTASTTLGDARELRALRSRNLPNSQTAPKENASDRYNVSCLM